MRILVANPFGIGDVLFTLPLLYAIREQQPEAYLSFLCNRRTEPVVSCWKMLDNVSVFEKDEFRHAWRSSKREGLQLLGGVVAGLRRQKIDAMIDLSLGWQTGFMAALAGIRTRAGFNFKGRGRFLTKKVPIEGFHTKPVSEYYLELLSLLGFRRPEKRRYDFALPPEPIAEADRFLAGKELGRGTPVAGLVPGGGASWGPNAVFKQWPPDRFAEAADAIAQRRGMKVLLLGDAKERPLCEEVASRMKSVAVLATGLPLLTVAGLLKQCSVVVGNDGGLIHLAASQGTRTVAIFGPVDAAVYGPMPAAAHRTVGKGLDCQPCYHGFRFPPCPIDNACLKTLEVAQVTAAVEALEQAK